MTTQLHRCRASNARAVGKGLSLLQRPSSRSCQLSSCFVENMSKSRYMVCFDLAFELVLLLPFPASRASSLTDKQCASASSNQCVTLWRYVAPAVFVRPGESHSSRNTKRCIDKNSHKNSFVTLQRSRGFPREPFFFFGALWWRKPAKNFLKRPTSWFVRLEKRIRGLKSVCGPQTMVPM